MKTPVILALLLVSSSAFAQEARKPVPPYMTYMKMCMQKNGNTEDRDKFAVALAWCQCNAEKQQPVGTLVTLEQSNQTGAACTDEFKADVRGAVKSYAQRAIDILSQQP